jgi:uncharacterized damage-inducible protein DinB
MKSSSEVTLLLRSIEEGYRKKAWHGPNLRGSIRGLTAREAAWRPGRGRHNIREITVHCAYWKYAVRRRIRGEQRGSFPLKGSNWFRRSGKPSDAAWKADVRLLDQMHKKMIDTIEELTARDLRRKPRRSKVDIRAIVAGIAMHDVYHAGQIQLIKRLM